MRYCKSTIFQANHNLLQSVHYCLLLFAILQKYDFSSKSQRCPKRQNLKFGCLRYCKSTIFQANHNTINVLSNSSIVVCDTAKVRFFKQITTATIIFVTLSGLFAILQKYDFSSKSQLVPDGNGGEKGCLRYCKSTIFQANHNWEGYSRKT